MRLVIDVPALKLLVRRVGWSPHILRFDMAVVKTAVAPAMMSQKTELLLVWNARNRDVGIAPRVWCDNAFDALTRVIIGANRAAEIVAESDEAARCLHV